MPRQDVPYGGALCRLRERIAEIWDKLGEKLHTINGVPGDGDGNVKIVSGSPAVVVNNDAAQNEIEIALDSSQLPAAAVSSVNGETGAVVLDAGDIPSVGGDVQSDIQDLANDISGNTAAINAEALARANADSALQTNINAALASIPDMSVTPDLYKGVERDAQGRAFAADPASGAVDQSLVTANWASQTGDSAPNNLIHKTGNERKTGVLNTSAPYLFRSAFVPSTSDASRTNYHRVLSFTRSTMNNTKFEITIIGGLNNTRTAFAKILLSFGSLVNDVTSAPLISISSALQWCVNIKLIRTADTVDLWIREAQYVQYCAYCTTKYSQYVDINSTITGLAIGDLAASADPSSEPDTVATIPVASYNTYPIEVACRLVQDWPSKRKISSMSS